MTIPTLTTLPVAPARTDPPATFVTRADAFLAAIVTFQGEMNTSIGAMNTDIAGVNADAIAAAASASSAASSATAAANAAGAALWVSGQAYAEGDAAISLVNYQTYRAETATSGTTDPSLDANWTAISGTFPVQTGNAGKYLTTDGTNPSWGVVASGSSQLTATGNISAGQPVALRSDGTVEPVSGLFSQAKAGTFATLTSGATSFNYPQQKSCYDTVNKKTITAYRNPSDGYVYAVIVTNTDGVITFSTPVVVSTNSIQSTSCLDIAYSVDEGAFVIVYRQTSTVAGVVAGQISGSTISLGTEVTFVESPLQDLNIEYDTASNNFVTVYQGAGSRARARVIEVTGTTVTVNTDVQVATAQVYGNYVPLKTTYDPVNEIVVFAYTNLSAQKCYANAFSISGTTITIGLAAESAVFSVGVELVLPAYEPESGKIIVWAGLSSVDSPSYLMVLSLSGLNITFSAANNMGLTGSFSNYITAHNLGSAVSYSANKLFLNICGVDFYPKLYRIKVSGTTAYYDKTYNISPNSLLYFAVCSFDPDAGTLIFSAVTDTNPDPFFFFTYGIGAESTNANKYIGIAAESISNGVTGEISTTGGINSAVSGLTVGQEYYVDANGDLTTSETNYKIAGRALAADKLLIADSNVQSKNTYKVIATGNVPSGEPISILADGTVEVVSGEFLSNSAEQLSVTNIESSTGTMFASAYNEDDGIIMLFQDIWCYAGRVENGGITWGPSAFNTGTNSGNWHALTYNKKTNKFILVHRVSAGYPNGKILTVSASLVITASGNTTLYSAGSGIDYSLTSHDKENYFYFSFYNNQTNNLIIQVVRINATNMTVMNSRQENNYSKDTRIKYHPNLSKYFCTYVYNGNTPQIVVANVSADGSADSNWTVYSLPSAFNTGLNFQQIYLPKVNKLIFYYSNADNLRFLSCNVSSTGVLDVTTNNSDVQSLAMPTGGDATHGPIIYYHELADRFVCTTRSNSGYGYVPQQYVVKYDVASNVFSFDGGVTYLYGSDFSSTNILTGPDTAQAGYDAALYIPSLGKSLDWYKYQNSPFARAVLNNPPYISSNVSSYLGVSAESISNGEEGRVYSPYCGINSIDGLAINTTYYLDSYGQATTTDTGVLLGKSIDDKKLLLKDS